MRSAMNARGFTLFTAIISFVLIGLTGVLVVSMINTERQATDTISTIDEQSEMQSIADLARADAVQAFNYGVRLQIEKMIAQQGTEFYILKDSVITGKSEKDWETIVASFAASEFGSEERTLPDGTRVRGHQELSNRMTNHLVLLLENTTSTSKYRICLVLGDGATCSTPAGQQSDRKLRENLQSLILEMARDRENPLLEPVECNAKECKTGTFYINLDFSKLSDKEYEELPKIRVESLVSGRAIMEPILPKGNLRIYVPLRLFLALRKSQDIATQLFSSTSQFAGWGLGMCDSGCLIRETPFGRSAEIKDKSCPGDKRPSQFTNAKLECDNCPEYYNPNNLEEMKGILEIVFKNNTCNRINPNMGISLPSEFELSTQECGGLDFGSLETTPEHTKVIHHYLGKREQGNYDNGEAYCVSPKTMNIAAEFTETDTKYMVDKEGGESHYRVRFVAGLAQKTAQKQDCYSVDRDGEMECSATRPA